MGNIEQKLGDARVFAEFVHRSTNPAEKFFILLKLYCNNKKNRHDFSKYKILCQIIRVFIIHYTVDKNIFKIDNTTFYCGQQIFSANEIYQNVISVIINVQ